MTMTFLPELDRLIEAYDKAETSTTSNASPPRSNRSSTPTPPG
jgi:hypothetical protein